MRRRVTQAPEAPPPPPPVPESTRVDYWETRGDHLAPEHRLAIDEVQERVPRPELAPEFEDVDVAAVMDAHAGQRGPDRDYKCVVRIQGTACRCQSCSTSKRPRASLYLERHHKLKKHPNKPKSWRADSGLGGGSVSFTVWLCRACCTPEGVGRSVRNRFDGPEELDREGPLPDDWASGGREVNSYPPAGYLCSECYQPQYETPGGACCVNGHGGVEGIEPPHQGDCPVLAQATTECVPPGSCAAKAADAEWRPGGAPPCRCGGITDLEIYEHRAATCAKDCFVGRKCPDNCDCEEERYKLKLPRGDGHLLGCGEHVRAKCPHTPEDCPENNMGAGTCYETQLYICARCSQAEGELEKTCPVGCVEGCPERAKETEDVGDGDVQSAGEVAGEGESGLRGGAGDGREERPEPAQATGVERRTGEVQPPAEAGKEQRAGDERRLHPARRRRAGAPPAREGAGGCIVPPARDMRAVQDGLPHGDASPSEGLVVPVIGARVRFVSVPTTPLVQVEELGAVPEGVKGSIVKVAPVLRASERETFNGAAVAAELRAAGALAVQLSPVTLPDSVSPEAQRKVASAVSPQEAVRAYFSEVKGVPPDELADAEALAMELVEVSGGSR